MKKYKITALLALTLAFCGCDKETITVYDYDVPTVTADGSAPASIYEHTWDMPDEMPIIGWRGIPKDKFTNNNAKIMKEGGFTTTLSFFSTKSQLEWALEVADQAGIDIIARWPDGFYADDQETVDEAVAFVDGNSAFAGYFVVDEPKVPDLPTNKAYLDKLYAAGATKYCYCNLVGYSTAHWYNNDCGVADAYEYVQTCIDALDPPFLSFDYYPIQLVDDEIVLKGRWYQTMEIFREYSIKTGKPFMAFALSCPHTTGNNSYPDPTVGHLRLQVNVALAYGAQGIQYYTYWQPNGEGGQDDYTMGYFNPPIDEDGNPTTTYYKVQQVNAEIKAVEPYFYKGTVTKVVHFTDEFEGVNIVSSSAGAVGSLVTSRDGVEYVAVVNKSFDTPMTISRNGETIEMEEGEMKVFPR